MEKIKNQEANYKQDRGLDAGKEGNIMRDADESRGKRLDVWLSHNIPNCSRKEAKRLLDSGRVLVNGRRVYIAGWQLKPRDRVEVLSGEKKGKDSSYVKVIFEDRDIIVVDKPAGVLSVAENGSPRTSMEGMVRAYLRKKYGGASYIKPVHRLDAETSGAMVFAKSKEGEKLESQFKHHQIARQYIAVVSGRVLEEAGAIKAPLEKGDFGGGRKSCTTVEKAGRHAVTEFQVKERYENATLLELSVKTGRTHQIRVHLAHIGHPVVGDKVYGKVGGIPRQALHAHILGFKHPATGKWMRFESKPPDDIKKLIDRLRGY